MKKIIYGILAILLVIVVGFIFLSVYKGSESSGNQKPKTEIIVNVKSLEKVSELVLLNASIQKVKSLDKDKPYTLYDTSGGILSYSTKDIDTGEAVAEGFSNKEQQGFIKDNKKLLKESAEKYYSTMIKSLDHEAKVTIETQK